MHRGSKSEKLVELICACSAYLHDGQRQIHAASKGLTHDRTRSHAETFKGTCMKRGIHTWSLRQSRGGSKWALSGVILERDRLR